MLPPLHSVTYYAGQFFFSIFQLLSCDKPTGRRLIFYLSRNESDDNVSG